MVSGPAVSRLAPAAAGALRDGKPLAYCGESYFSIFHGSLKPAVNGDGL